MVARLQVLDQFVHLVMLVQRMAGRVEAGVVHQDRRVEKALLGRGMGGQLDAQLGEQLDAARAVCGGAQQLAAQRTLAFVTLA